MNRPVPGYPRQDPDSTAFLSRNAEHGAEFVSCILPWFDAHGSANADATPSARAARLFGNPLYTLSNRSAVVAYDLGGEFWGTVEECGRWAGVLVAWEDNQIAGPDLEFRG